MEIGNLEELGRLGPVGYSPGLRGLGVLATLIALSIVQYRKRRMRTMTEKLAARNAKVVAKMKREESSTNEIHKRIARGEITAGQALLQKAKPCNCNN